VLALFPAVAFELAETVREAHERGLITGEATQSNSDFREDRRSMRGIDPEGLERFDGVRVHGLGQENPSGDEALVNKLKKVNEILVRQMLDHVDCSHCAERIWSLRT